VLTLGFYFTILFSNFTILFSKNKLSNKLEGTKIMRLFVLGATGGTGKQLVDLALQRGHQVTAFVRSPQKISHREHLTIVEGDPLNADRLVSALPGHDVILSALGAIGRGQTTLLGDCARSTIEAASESGVKRLFVVSSALLFPDAGLIGAVLSRFVFGNVLRDSLEMERVVKNSGLDWTIVRPVRLTNGSCTERWRFEVDRIPRGGFSISRADVAHFLLETIEQDAHLQQVIGLSL
jgi:putative NADH-flavin reductase